MIGVCVSSVSRAQPKVTLLGYLFFRMHAVIEVGPSL